MAAVNNKRKILIHEGIDNWPGKRPLDVPQDQGRGRLTLALKGFDIV